MSKLSAAQQRYLAILNDEEWHSATDIAQRVGLGASGVARGLSHLAQKKFAAWQAPSDYAITKAGQTALQSEKLLRKGER